MFWRVTKNTNNSLLCWEVFGMLVTNNCLFFPYFLEFHNMFKESFHVWETYRETETKVVPKSRELCHGAYDKYIYN